MSQVHFVQPTEILLSPFRPRGQEQRAGHQNYVVAAQNFACVLAGEVLTAIVLRWKHEPHHNIQDDENNDGDIAEMTLHDASRIELSKSQNQWRCRPRCIAIYKHEFRKTQLPFACLCGSRKM